MNEKDLQQNPKTLLEMAYEVTNNKWRTIMGYDLNRALTYRFNHQNRERRFWILSESINPERQAEVIHLLELVKKIEEENFKHCYIYLSEEKGTNEVTSVEPLYIPNTQDDDPPLLQIRLNDGNSIVIKENTLLYKPS